MLRSARHYVRLALAAMAGAAVLVGAALPTDSTAADSNGGTTTYRWVDAQGVVHYSDTPQPGAERLQIQPAQTFADQAINPGTQTAAPQADPPPVYQLCVINQPSTQQSFYSPDSVAVSVQLSPTLRDGDQLSVTFDGQALSPADDSGLNFQVSAPDRGAHVVEAVVRSPDGHTVCTAPPVTFYVRQPSLVSPASAAQGHGAEAAPGVPHAPTVPHN